MPSTIEFDPIRLPPEAEELRTEVREFLDEEIAAGTFDPETAPFTNGFNREFARKVGAKGWIGMTWPKKYGGQERSFLERYVVTEEFRAIAAPTRVFFTADRQSGPVLIKYANEDIKMDVLPRITRGECCFCIGMSEPGSGSDLFAAGTATSTRSMVRHPKRCARPRNISGASSMRSAHASPRPIPISWARRSRSPIYC